MHVSRSSRVVLLTGSTTLILKGSAQERRPSPGPDVLTAPPHFARLAAPTATRPWPARAASISRYNKEPPTVWWGSCESTLAVAYFPHPVAQAVSSALRRFTSVFGMGTGGPTSL